MHELLTAMSKRLEAVDIPGLRGVSYPVIDRVPASPWVMLRQGENFPSVYTRTRGKGEQVSVQVEAVLLIASTPETPRDQTALDRLIEPIIDTFDPQAWGMDIADLLKVNSSEIDHVFTIANVTRSQMEWGTQFCHAATIQFDAVIRRQPKPLLMKEVLQ